MRDTVIIDCESQKLADDVPGRWDSVHLMGMSCTVIYELKQDRFRTYDHNELEAVKERILKAEEVVSYNGQSFDFPLLWQLPNRQCPKEVLPKSNDLLRRIAVARNMNPDHPSAHRNWGLDSTCTATIGRGKIDSAVMAPEMFRNQEWGRLLRYCIDDVALTRDLYLFIEKYGYVLNKNCDRVQLPHWNPLLPPAIAQTHAKAA